MSSGKSVGSPCTSMQYQKLYTELRLIIASWLINIAEQKFFRYILGKRGTALGRFSAYRKELLWSNEVRCKMV